MKILRVEAGLLDYDVVVGPLADCRSRLSELARGAALTVVTEPHVWSLHGPKLEALVACDPIFVPRGEAAKDWPHLQALIAAFAERNLGRNSPVLAFGGGAVGDLTGLATGLFKRGLPIIHVPTTLLAQADSAIGGKTAIDAAGQKNLVGTFHPPALVVVDPSLLDTLDPRQLASGYAEVLKYGLIGDPAFFAWCEAHGAALLAGDRDARLYALTTCIRAKSRIVAVDPHDGNGQRALLNLGHSFGHAIEAIAGIGALLHGEAVAIGMVIAFRLSVLLDQCPEDDTAQLADHLASVGLPTRLDQVGLAGCGEAMLQHLGNDKKATSAGPALILVRGIGRAYLDPAVPRAALESFTHSL